MTEEAKRPPAEQLNAYVTELKRLLFLRAWTIALPEEEPGFDAGVGDTPIASTFVSRQGKFAEIKFHPQLWDKPADAQRQTVTHELLHLHIEHFFSDLAAMLERSMGESAFHTTRQMVIDNMERIVDGLADAFEQFLPLPPWAADKISNDGEDQPGDGR